MLFQYIASDPVGRTVRGVLEAESEAQAESRLWGDDLVIIELRPQQQGRGLSPGTGRLTGIFWPITTRRLDEIWGPLADLLTIGVVAGGGAAERGLPLPAALRVLREGCTHPGMRRLLAEVADAVEQGAGLAAALEPSGALLPLVSRLLSSAEENGDLPATLRRLASVGAGARTMLAPLRDAVARAFWMVLATAGAGSIVMWVWAPALAAMQAANLLAAPGRLMVWLVQQLSTYNWWVAGAVVFLGLMIILGAFTPAGRRMATQIAWRMPMLRVLVSSIEMARLCRSFGLVIEAGMSWEEIVDMLPHSTPDPILQETLLHVRSDLLDGESLGETLRRYPALPASLSEVLGLPAKDSAQSEQPVAALAKAARLATYYDAQARQAALSLAHALRVGATIFCLGTAVWIIVSLAAAWRLVAYTVVSNPIP